MKVGTPENLDLSLETTKYTVKEEKVGGSCLTEQGRYLKKTSSERIRNSLVVRLSKTRK